MPLPAAEADLVLDVAGNILEQRGRGRLELGGDVGDRVPGRLVGIAGHDLHDLDSQIRSNALVRVRVHAGISLRPSLHVSCVSTHILYVLGHHTSSYHICIICIERGEM